MALDVILGLVVLIAAIRGWFRGFLIQAVQLVALVASISLAQRGASLARPYLVELLPKFSPELLDRLLWWTSAVLLYIVLSGVPIWAIRAQRKRHLSDPDVARGDRGAGFLFGALKGGVIAAFLAAGILRVAPAHVPPGGVVEAQTNQSYALRWSTEYQPADKLWTSRPVRYLADEVRAHGLGVQTEASAASKTEATVELKPAAPEPAAAAPAPAATARSEDRPKTLRIAPPPPRTRTRTQPSAEPLDPNRPDFLNELDRRLRSQGLSRSQ